MDAHEVVARLKELANQLDKVPTFREWLASGQTEWQVKKNFTNFSSLLCAAGLKTYKERRDKLEDTPPPLPEEILEKKTPKVLVIDIETSTMLVEAYGLFDQNIPITKIARDWFILSFAARFLDETETHYLDIRDEKDFNDHNLLMVIHSLLSKADVVMGHNAKKFDVKKINARFLKHNMSPPSSYRVIDTLTIAKKHFALSSNKLDYIAKYLGCTPKYKTHKFTQEQMWQECLLGNVEAWEENKIYNLQDIETTVEVWEKLKVWDKTINWSIFTGSHKCSCGSTGLDSSGDVFTNNGIFQRLTCSKCGKEFKDKSNQLSAAQKREIYS